MKLPVTLNRTTFMALLVLICINLYGQRTLHGVVQDEAGEKLPGIVVQLVGTNTSTNTDAHGEFSLKYERPNPTLTFMSLGYFTKQVQAGESEFLTVTLIEDSVFMNEPIRGCGCVYRYTNLGVVSGLSYGPYGLKAENFTPYLFGKSIFLSSTIEWRMNYGDIHYFNIFLRKPVWGWDNISTGIYGGYKSFTVPETGIQEFDLAGDFRFNGFRVSAGYARQQFESEQYSLNANGVYFEVYKILFGQLQFDVKGKYVNEQMQYDIRIAEDIRKLNLVIGTGYEKIGNFEELSLSALYKIVY